MSSELGGRPGGALGVGRVVGGVDSWLEGRGFVIIGL